MRQVRLAGLALVGWTLAGGISWAQSDSLAPLLKTIREVGPEGKGNLAASQAWAELAARSDADQLPMILGAIDGASPLAANWLRSAFDAVAERQARKDGKLPIAELEKFLHERQHNSRARRLAYEWIARNDLTAPDRLIPQMLDDPSLELRRDAVARVLMAAEKASAEQNIDLAMSSYRKALGSARDLDQIKVVTEALKKLGQPVDLAHHFGFLLDWKLLGPFDNHQGKGFEVAYPPEATIDVAASYPVQSGKIRWNSHHTSDEYGMVDLNKAIGKHMGAVAYAVAEFQSDKPRPIELRLGSESANKIWLNGVLLSTAEVYHANGTMDQYVGRGELKAGRNVILLKICQNEQTETWAQDWKFQLRVCDATGKAVLATDRPAPRAGDNQTAANESTSPNGPKE
ncbi:MAG: hypothetical protein HY288_16580 [Planctomycetia bacterium]|nr:hypothetical protein [Planctomycetia bacterium]